MPLIPGTKTSFLLSKPSFQTNKVIIFIPGMSAGATTSKYDDLANLSTQNGWALLRLDIWNDSAEIRNRSIDNLVHEIERVASFLKEEGYLSISAIGKSFGAALLLCCDGSIGFSSQVLWAPVFTFEQNNGNINETRLILLDKIKSVAEITIPCSFLSKIITPTLIIHGENDGIVPLSNSKNIVSCLQNGSLVTIPNMGHSLNEGVRPAVFDKTFQFIHKETTPS